MHEYLYGPTAELELTSLAHSSSYLIWVNHLSLQTLVYVGLFTLFHSQSQLQQPNPHPFAQVSTRLPSDTLGPWSVVLAQTQAPSDAPQPPKPPRVEESSMVDCESIVLQMPPPTVGCAGVDR